MSFPPATEMFQFAGFASTAYGFSCRYLKRGGLPHSEIPGSKGARASPGLFAACHVLHRLSAPRHSPDALHSLAPLQERAPLARLVTRAPCQEGMTPRLHPKPRSTMTAAQSTSKAEHPPRRLNRDGQKQAYHAWRSPNTAPRWEWRTTLDEPPDRTNSFEHRSAERRRRSLSPESDDRPRCPRSTRLASSRCKNNNRPPERP